MSEPIEDFLEVDQPIPGQNYALLSFVSPESVIQQRELFLVKHFLGSIYQREVSAKEENEKNTNSTSSRAQVDKKGYYTGLKPGYKLPETFNEFLESFEDFRFSNEEKVNKLFNDQYKNTTSVRGVKVRGVYDTIEHARKKAKALQTADPSFNVFVGQVGYWLPWDPTNQSHKIEDEVFANEQLNNLMKKYKENNESRDVFYNELKQDRIEYHKKVYEEEKKAQETKNAIEGGETTEETGETVEETQSNSDNNFREVVQNIF